MLIRDYYEEIMENKRAGLNLEGTIDLEELFNKKIKSKPLINKKELESVAENSGFISRQAYKKNRRRKKSPFECQIGIKVRPDIKELFQDIGEYLDVYDHTTFELAVLALLEKENVINLLNRFKKITSKT